MTQDGGEQTSNEEKSLYVMVTNLFLKIIWKTAWERDEFWLADVCPDVLYKINREINKYMCK